MTDVIEGRTIASTEPSRKMHDRHSRLVEMLIDRFPDRIKSAAHWLRRPSSRWLRIPAGVLLIAGSVLFILPVFGLWMLPLGLLLLAEDVPALRRLRNRVLDATHRRWPHWFSNSSASQTGDAAPPATDCVSPTPNGPFQTKEELMDSMSKREKGMEAEFKHKEELAFRMTVRRNRLFGLWAAARLGLTGEAAETYAKSVVASDFEEPGDDDILAKVRGDLAEAGAPSTDAELRAELGRAGVEARL
jgi:hypothetical protein